MVVYVIRFFSVLLLAKASAVRVYTVWEHQPEAQICTASLSDLEGWGCCRWQELTAALFVVQSGTCDPPSALIQVVTDELARGSLDIHQAATILGSVLPMQTLLQIAMCQQAAEALVPAIAPPTPARAPQQELLQSGRATWSAELGWVWV